MLIHELLHHAESELTHEEIYELAEDLRRGDVDAPIPLARDVSEISVDDIETGRERVHRDFSENRANEFLNRLWLEATDLREPARSPTTGRFLKRFRSRRFSSKLGAARMTQQRAR